jgi:RNA polymerase sigma-70 factor (ECF subfamily)
MTERLRGTTPDPWADLYTAETPREAQNPEIGSDEAILGDADSNWLALVKSIRRGERIGLEELYRVFSRGIRFYLCRQLGPQDLDGKVHDTFLTVVQAIRKGELAEPNRLMDFVRTMVRRQVAAQIDRTVQNQGEHAKLDTSSPIEERVATSERPGGLLVGREASEILQTALQRLSPDLREVVILRDLQEMEYREIAEVLKVPEGTVKSRLNRGRAELARVLRLSDHDKSTEEEPVLRQHEEVAEAVLRIISSRDREILTRFYLMEQAPEEICREMNLSETQFRLLKSRAKARFGELGRKKLSRTTVRPGESQGSRVQSLDRDISRIVPTIAHAVAVFGDEKKASHWLSTPLPLFANRTPSQVLDGEGGIEAVEQILTRIEHNIPS